ncbi:DUF397 domain-containing protein [Actinopolyspora erythraea]|uniref:DUF397 domain-containing protein n=1 Tax=Actinopolyspora erythraea TaxID=414996 RepID=A0A099D0J0_9ACTN|nr:DUF397 domain-containing protein [Actinopolyspora erythraea]ASU79677.1 DUF397 domain-containing protein [Actinopolyspora erythraea]KGI79504.1 hypothetical protein IL38_23160 [Actinopolyspora erythraea]
MTTPHTWRKTSRSSTGNACVEVGRLADGAAIRDTKNRTGGHLTTTRAQWAAFITALKTDRFA